MPRNTDYKPTKISEFESIRLQYNPIGVRQVVSINSETNIDFYFADDNLLTGLWLVGRNITDGDYLKMQIIDTDNVLGLGIDAVIRQFGDKWYLPDSNCDQQFDVSYPAKIYAGMSLRIIYHSISTSLAPILIVNYKLHLILG